jgi:plastocyanin
MFRGLNTQVALGVLAIVGLLVVFTLFAQTNELSQTPVGEGGELDSGASPTSTTSVTPPPTGVVTPPGTSRPATPPVKQPPALPTIVFLSPTAGEKWVIGEVQAIRWQRGSIQLGGLALLNASTRETIGWVLSTVSRNQAGYEWDVRRVAISRGSPVFKDVLPGTYIFRLAFDGPEQAVESPTFSIIYPSQVTVGMHQLSIQNLSFIPSTLRVKQNDKVVIMNNDTITHTLSFSVAYPSQRLTPGMSYTLSTASLNPGKYELYSVEYPTTQATLLVE